MTKPKPKAEQKKRGRKPVAKRREDAPVVVAVRLFADEAARLDAARGTTPRASWLRARIPAKGEGR